MVICEIKNCTKKATYALTYKNPKRCKKHKENMKPQTIICICGCDRPIFAYNYGDKLKHCSKCKLDGMINVKSRKCKEDNCNIIPCYNYEGKTKRLYCKEHKLNGMIDVKHKICKYNGICYDKKVIF